MVEPKVIGWCLVLLTVSGCQCLWIDSSGGYKDVLMAVDSSPDDTDCKELMNKMKELATVFSKHLWLSTEAEVRLSTVDVLLPAELASRCDVTNVGNRQKWSNADLQIRAAAHSDVTGHEPHPPGAAPAGLRVGQPLGCGAPGDVIRMDARLLTILDGQESNPVSQNGVAGWKTTYRNATEDESSQEATRRRRVDELGRALVTSWARYRWGVFEDFPTGEGSPPQETSTGGDQRGSFKTSQIKRCENETSNCDHFPTQETENPNYFSFSQDTVSHPQIHQLSSNPQERICGKSFWEILKSHRDFQRNSIKKFEIILPSTKTLQSPTTRPVSRPNLQTPEPIDNFQQVSSVAKDSKVQTTKSEPLVLSSFDSSKPDDSTVGKLKRKRRFSRDTQTDKKESDSEDGEKDAPTASSFIGTLPPAKNVAEVKDPKRTTHVQTSTNPSRRKSTVSTTPGTLLHSTLNHSREKTSVAWASPILSSTSVPSLLNNSVTWIKAKEHHPKDVPPSINWSTKFTNSRDNLDLVGFEAPKIRFVATPPKAVVIALDLSSSSVHQASVEWLRGGLLRWLFGIGSGVNVGILASYSNTSFPLSLGPLAPGPSTARHLEEYMTLLPYQHEVDDEVYGGLYCLGCVIYETEKMLLEAGVPLDAGVLVLAVCEPDLTLPQMKMALRTPITIHTLALCPNAPKNIERLAEKHGTWALSQASVESGFMAELQLGLLMTKITESTLLWPSDSRLHTVYEEDKMLREDDVERVGAYRRVKGTITFNEGTSPRLLVLASSSSAKIVEVFIGEKRIQLNRDTTRRYWATLEGSHTTLSYSLKYLSTSLELPLVVTIGVYESSIDAGIKVTLRTSTQHYKPMDVDNPYLRVWAEVTKDGNIVRDASVSISVTYLSGLTPSTYSLMLLDDGSAEPDTILGDGIYTRYLTWTPGPGRYVLTASATSTSETVSEVVEDGVVRVKRTGHFVSGSSPISLIVETVPPGDIFPPSRITTLNVTPIKDSLVNVSWIAPGGDLDQGSAWRYQLKMYTEKSALSEENFESSGIDVYCLQGEERAPMPSPALFGTSQSCITSIPFMNLIWYFAIRAIDGANNTGKISNVVSVYIYEPTTTATSEQSGNEDVVQKVMMSTVIPRNKMPEDGGEDNWQVYGAALIGAVGFVMLSIVLFACIICCRKAKKRAANDPERPIYKIYVNNAYIQEEDGEIKVVSKEKSLAEKDSTQQWVNSLDKYSSADAVKEEPADVSGDHTDPAQSSPNKYPKPVRFGVLTNGSIMRELPASSSSSSSSKPSDEAIPDDFKYKDLSETISNSTTDGATASTSSAATEISTADAPVKEPPRTAPKPTLSFGYDVSYPPLGIPTLPGPTVISIHSNSNGHIDYHSDDEGGFRPRRASRPGPGPRKHLPPHFSSFRYLPPPSNIDPIQRQLDYSSTFINLGKANTALPHGTVRSVKKRRHISFV